MKIISNNKKAFRDYEILDKYEAGISLLGWEVKSARASQVNLANAYCSIYKGEMFLKEAHFNKYMLLKVDELRDRKLLLHKSEIAKINFTLETQPLTLIPLKMYFKNGKIKLEIALAKGLKKYDKRQKLAQEETNKRLQKAIKNYL
ncbi:SsrA-binding protein SmpB [Mycoplasmopsis citelli]|uniref:SsrA-binding protein n=1 Tax=Mycoplasmopsis citelli TaxID=171281 RepID=A0A449B322_9BACT|nr:SsrA-binding protein SmpB [Mycoplasmopsis citelli]UUD36416.1 SsrA-binding protein SmpB [Mycoplasmopsis citelli]VEU74999.1 SsrA RNA (tmRNA)-binding protein [Mycoplasmopsis citelli]